jgi:hypothetical protein
MSLFWDGLISIFSFYYYFQVKNRSFKSSVNYSKFFFWMGISTFLGMFGHLFFPYFAIYGKFPAWICIVITAYFFSITAIELTNITSIIHWKKGLLFKSTVLLGLSFYMQTFNFIAIDSIFSYVILGTICGLKLRKTSTNNFLLLGSILIYPTILIFGCKISIHPLFNKDDFSHLFILISLFFYYFCTTKIKDYDV